MNKPDLKVLQQIPRYALTWISPEQWDAILVALERAERMDAALRVCFDDEVHFEDRYAEHERITCERYPQGMTDEEADHLEETCPCQMCQHDRDLRAIVAS